MRGDYARNLREAVDWYDTPAGLITQAQAIAENAQETATEADRELIDEFLDDVYAVAEDRDERG